MERINNRLENYQRALETLRKGCIGIKKLNDLEKDGSFSDLNLPFNLPGS